MKQFDLQGNEYDCTIEIPLKKATYEDIQALNINLQTQLFVKDKEIESLREHTSNQDRIIADANNRIYKAIEKAEQMLKTYYESNMANDMKNICDLLKILKGDK